MKEKILHHLSEVRPEFNFEESDDYIAAGMLDSFDIEALVTAMDEDFGISIEGTEIVPENFKNVETITQLLIRNGAEI